MREHGPWKIRSTREAHRDRRITVTVDEVVRADGSLGAVTVVEIRPSVCVLAVDNDGVIHLAEEFRYAIGRRTIEGVGGTIETGEDPLDAARRALREALGIDAAECTQLGTVDPLTSFVRAPVHVFLAERLTFGRPHRDLAERGRPVAMPLAEAAQAVSDGRITHAPTCVAILQAAARVEVVPMAPERSTRRRVRALVIEDNRDAAASLQLLLEQLGCEAVTAYTGPAGVDAAHSAPPDIVFCDIGLPGLDGYEVARRIRTEAWGPRVVLVAVTGYGREEDRRNAEAAGFDMHFVKPADPGAITRLFKDLGLPG
jgi:ADP-ribose pyrophosphatase